MIKHIFTVEYGGKLELEETDWLRECTRVNKT